MPWATRVRPSTRWTRLAKLKMPLVQIRCKWTALAEEWPVYEGITPAVAEEAIEPLEACLDQFWELGDGLQTFQAPIIRPAVEAGLLKRLGKPPFERKPGEIVEALAPFYAAATDHALCLALGDEDVENGTR